MSLALLPFHTVDVFTQTAFTGNPLAIVMDADDLTPGQMQIIAREFNLSETIFVQRPRNPAHTARVRIFFPTAEIPFAGHPTIGCAIHLALQMHGEGVDFEVELVLEEEAGLVPVRVVSSGRGIKATLTAPVLPHCQGEWTPDIDLVASALGTDLSLIGFDNHRCGVHAGGPAFLYVPVGSLEALAQINIREPWWSRLMKEADVDSAYVYTRAENGADYQARMFSPTAGIPEDPATGSATAIFANQLFVSGELASGTTALKLLQGIEMGRRSELELEIDQNAGKVSAVRVSGASVPVSSGRVRIP